MLPTNMGRAPNPMSSVLVRDRRVETVSAQKQQRGELRRGAGWHLGAGPTRPWAVTGQCWMEAGAEGSVSGFESHEVHPGLLL